MSDDRRDDDSQTVSHTLEVVEGRQAPSPELRAELERVARQERPRILAMARRIVRNAETAEEIAQDALVQAIQDLPKFRRESSLRVWICGIARNKALNRVRRVEEFLQTDGIVEKVEEGLGVLQELTRAERIAVVKSVAAAVLDEKDRDVVHYRYAESLDYATIAVCLDLQGGANEVRVALQRANRRLKPALVERLKQLGHSRSFVFTRDDPNEDQPT